MAMATTNQTLQTMQEHSFVVDNDTESVLLEGIIVSTWQCVVRWRMPFGRWLDPDRCSCARFLESGQAWYLPRLLSRPLLAAYARLTFKLDESQRSLTDSSSAMKLEQQTSISSGNVNTAPYLSPSECT